MAELLKNIYNQAFFDRFIDAWENICPDFDGMGFLSEIYDDEWEDRALKERIRHINVALNNNMKGSYSQKLEKILRCLPELLHHGFNEDMIEFLFIPDFVEVFGVESPDISVPALEQITQFITCELAIRVFIKNDPQEVMQQLLKWSKHPHPAVRRLASEGSRPRLPWAMGVPELKKDPSPILPILENLKNDTSETVRRSVANNLNDISKDHPELVVGIAQKWFGRNENTDRLVKHASRTLLKNGHPKVLAIFGYGKASDIQLSRFKIMTPKVKMGEELKFEFSLKSLSSSPMLLRIEYGMYYLRSNGSHNRKVFKISEREIEADFDLDFTRNQSFKAITTRRYYPGLHHLSLIVNGEELDNLSFELIAE